MRLSDATDTHLRAAEVVWKRLCKGHDGIGWVTAGKVLARKRPHLIPVLDDVVMTNLHLPTTGAWKMLHDALADEQRRRSIDNLLPDQLSLFVPTLRILDVAVWMTFGRSQRAKVSQELAEFESDRDVQPM